MPTPSTHRARKRFGQNFLTDAAALDAIVTAIAPQSAEHFLEIGAGFGALSLRLAPLCARLQALELDKDILAWWAQQTLPNNLEILAGDALRFDFARQLQSLSASAAAPRLCGNLPYNVASPILGRLLELGRQWQDGYFLLQKEFAERLCASTGAPSYSRLSVLTQFRASASLVLELAPECFQPAPKVHSALVRLQPRAGLTAADARLYSCLARVSASAFGSRRKKIGSTLKPWLASAAWERLDLSPDSRPQQLSLEDFVRIARYCLAQDDQS